MNNKDLLRELDDHAVDAASLKWRRCFERAAETIRQLEANVGGGDTAIKYLEQENEHLRAELDRRHCDFDHWIESTFCIVSQQLQVGAVPYSVRMKREQADKLLAHLVKLVEQLPTLDERLAALYGPVCVCGKETKHSWGHSPDCPVVNQPPKCAATCGADIFGGTHTSECPLSESQNET